MRRDGKLISRLEESEVKVLQREVALVERIFDGRMTANVFLKDIRTDDIVEYMFSLKGQNPVFGNQHSGSFVQQWSLPVARTFAKLLWPTGRELYVKLQNKALAPTIKEGANYREYLWDIHNVPARTVENDAPSWFDPYPFVQYGEYKDWQAVVSWAMPLYQIHEPKSPTIKALAERIAALGNSPELKMLEALRFVQKEVRYFGVEIGPSSHAPNPPEVVLERRFGDCKDKTLLTIALFRNLGIDAYPALVNTSLRHQIQTLQPSPGAFNHVLVYARIGGEEFWFDPTRLPQKGKLDRIVQADYGLALVIDEKSVAPRLMAGNKALLSSRLIHAVLDSSAGLDKPATYSVVTEAEGRAAEAIRDSVARQSRESLQKSYLNFYSKYYNEIEQQSPLEIKDDGVANKITITEHYVIKKFWQRSEKTKLLEAYIEVPDVLDYLRQQRVSARDSPLALLHPVNLQHITEVRLPKPWNVKPDNIVVEDPAFEFNREEVWLGERTLLLKDRYKSRLDYIPANDVSRYTANVEKARQGASYSLTYNDMRTNAPDAGSLHWVPAVVGVLSVLGLIVLALRVYRWDPAPAPVVDSTTYPHPSEGIGGWLLFAALMLIVSIVMVCKVFVETWPSFTSTAWLALTNSANPTYHPLWLPALLITLVGSLAILAGMVLALVLFFKKRSSLPRVLIIVLVLNIALVVADHAVTLIIPSLADTVSAKEWGALLKSVIASVLWIAYFTRSKRVKATFVRRYGERANDSKPAMLATNAEESMPGRE